MLNPFVVKRSSRGFTLIEMLTILIMVGVLVAIAAPSWLSLANNQKAGASRDLVLQTLRQAQSDAARTKVKRAVQFNATANPPTIQGTGGVQSLSSNPNQIGLQVRNGTTAISQIEFDKNGSVITPDASIFDSNGIKITITSPPTTGQKRCVIVQTILGTMRAAAGDDCN